MVAHSWVCMDQLLWDSLVQGVTHLPGTWWGLDEYLENEGMSQITISISFSKTKLGD